ncbi:hypothetical protein A4A49_42502 [Nicotiana attenuata]|uniref:Uncharacterized protein n=1 Tax=Nicotiana attenuata TaxID=49451 RepID=A0A1J6HTA9_NICAT|nr:hypothetical protein A4A49_42502 [Nicotiana attenuata]
MQGILSSNNDNISSTTALLDGKSACTTIRFERRRLLSNAFTLSAGRALTSADRSDSHGKWSSRWEATASRYILVAMEKISGRSEDSRARFWGKRERVEREGRYGREKLSENEMRLRIVIRDICGVCIQMWPLMQCLSFERAVHERIMKRLSVQGVRSRNGMWPFMQIRGKGIGMYWWLNMQAGNEIGVGWGEQKTNASSRADIPVDRSLDGVANAVNLVRETVMMKGNDLVVNAWNVDEGAVENRVEHVVTQNVTADRVDAYDTKGAGQGSDAIKSQHIAAVDGVVIVPVAAALNRVAKDLKAATGPVFDQGSAGVHNGPGAGQKSAEVGHQLAKGHGQINVQNLTEGKEKGAGQDPNATGVLAIKDGQVTADSHKEPAPQVVKLSIDQAWSVVSHSPSKTNSTDLKNQRLAAKNIEVSNSFAALVNEHDCAMKKAGTDLQQMEDEARSVTGKTRSTGSKK